MSVKQRCMTITHVQEKWFLNSNLGYLLNYNSIIVYFDFVMSHTMGNIILTCTETRWQASLPHFQCIFGAKSSSAQDKENCLPFPQIQLQQSQCVYSDLHHLKSWYRFEQPEVRPRCLGMESRSGTSARLTPMLAKCGWST